MAVGVGAFAGAVVHAYRNAGLLVSVSIALAPFLAFIAYSLAYPLLAGSGPYRDLPPLPALVYGLAIAYGAGLRVVAFALGVVLRWLAERVRRN